jgi:hypothetical protein
VIVNRTRRATLAVDRKAVAASVESLVSARAVETLIVIAVATKRSFAIVRDEEIL